MATYFVDAIGGNDSANGLTEGTAWKTSVKVNTGPTFTGDDQILFKRGGVYSRLVLFSHFQPTDGHPITLGAYGTGAKPIITPASTVLTAWTPLGDGRYTAVDPTVLAVVVLEDWHDLKRNANSTLSAGEVWIDSANDVIYYKPSSGVPSDHEVRCGSAPALYFYERAANFIIEDLHFISTGPYAFDVAMRNVTFQRCDCTANATMLFITPTGETGLNVTVQDCLFQNNRQNIYFVAQASGDTDWENVVVRRNSILDTDIMWNSVRYSSWDPGDIDGISCQNTRNSIFEQNHITGGCYSGGIYLYFGAAVNGVGNIIRHNYIHDIDTAAVVWGGGDTETVNGDIYGNVFANVARLPPPVSFGAAYWGAFFLNRAQTPGRPTTIYNNLVYTSDVGIYFFTVPDHFIVRNNIFVNPSSGVHVMTPAAGVLNNVLDNNIYFGTTNTFDHGSGPVSFVAWKSATGEDANSQVADPMVTDPVGGVFTLQPSSPARDAGVNLGPPYHLALHRDSKWPDDVRTVDQGSQGVGWDIGAYAYLRFFLKVA